MIVTGDMNDAKQMFCRFTFGGVLKAALGGSSQGPCRPPPSGGIDWIFASRHLTIAVQALDRGALVKSISDHPFVFASVTKTG